MNEQDSPELGDLNADLNSDASGAADSPFDTAFDETLPEGDLARSDTAVLDDTSDADTPNDATDESAADSEAAIQASLEFIKNWQKLVSMTNWEKGKIISEWRGSLQESGAPVQDFSDESWSRMVGNVSGQHVGRLRRVFDRFGEAFENYRGLFWSHFQASLDWEDAEMWLEGAVQNDWSVAQMRSQRWESLGAPADQRPKAEDIITSDLDEDVNPRDDSDIAPPGTMGVIDGVDDSGSPFDANSSIDGPDGPMDLTGDGGTMTDFGDNFDPIRPFENIPKLPEDLQEAFDGLKIAILNHKVGGWRDVPIDNVLTGLNALKMMIMAPSGEGK